jgi:hypothetical protein
VTDVGAGPFTSAVTLVEDVIPTAKIDQIWVRMETMQLQLLLYHGIMISTIVLPCWDTSLPILFPSTVPDAPEHHSIQLDWFDPYDEGNAITGYRALGLSGNFSLLASVDGICVDSGLTFYEMEVPYLRIRMMKPLCKKFLFFFYLLSCSLSND